MISNPGQPLDALDNFATTAGYCSGKGGGGRGFIGRSACKRFDGRLKHNYCTRFAD